MSNTNDELSKINALDVRKNATSNANDSILNVRWSYTALDFANKDYAVNDEIMIDKKTGQIYYKTPEGKIVTHSSQSVTNVSNNIEIGNAITDITNNNKDYTILTPKDSSSLILTLDFPFEGRCDSNNIIDDVTNITDTEFSIYTKSNVFFIKVNTRETDKSYVELLTNKYNIDNHVNEVDNASVTYSVTYTDINNHSVTKTFINDIKLNTLVALKAPTIDDYTDDDDFSVIDSGIGSVVIQILSITSDKLKSVYSETHVSEKPYSDVIDSDGKIILSNMVIQAFFSSYNSLPNNENMTITNVSLSNYIISESEKNGGMTDEERAEIDAIKNQLSSLPKVIISDTEPEKWTEKDLWICPGELVSKSALNVMATNITFNKDEMEKFFVETNLKTLLSLNENDIDSIFVKIEE